MVDPKDKLTFTADEFVFFKSAIDGKYTRLSNDEVELDVAGRIIKLKATVEGEVLTFSTNNATGVIKSGTQAYQ